MDLMDVQISIASTGHSTLVPLPSHLPPPQDLMDVQIMPCKETATRGEHDDKAMWQGTRSSLLVELWLGLSSSLFSFH